MTDKTAPRTVLVADTDDGIRSLVRLTLGDESYEVLEAADAESALRTVATEMPDVLLVDVDLPGADGIAITRSLKSQPETDEIKVVLLFDKTDPVDEDAGREKGVDEFLAKPFTAFTLLKKLDEV